MERSKIREYLNTEFKSTNYCKKIRNTNKPESLKTLSIADLDFIEILKEFYSQLKLNYNTFKSDENWVPSTRQQYLLDSLSNINKDISHKDKIKLTNNYIMHLYDDFYWQIWDYFDDYNNLNEQF